MAPEEHLALQPAPILTYFLRQSAKVLRVHPPKRLTDAAVVGRGVALTVGVRRALLQGEAAVVGVCRRRGQG